jgi:hypothetical protein
VKATPSGPATTSTIRCVATGEVPYVRHSSPSVNPRATGSSAHTTRGPEASSRKRRKPACSASKEPPVVQVVGLDVRDDHRLGRQLHERAVALVGLDHEPAAAAPTRRPLPRPLTSPPTRKDGSRPAARRRQREQRGGGRLAVGAADGDRAAHGADGGERLGAAQHGDPGCPAATTSGFVSGDGGGHGHHVGPGTLAASWPTRPPRPARAGGTRPARRPGRCR